MDYAYLKGNYRLIAVDLSKQKAIDADPRAIQQIAFQGVAVGADWTKLRLYTILEKIFGHFWGCSRMTGGDGQTPPPPPALPKISHTYPTMMKVGTVIPYLKKTQKIFGSRDTSPDFCWNQHFFAGNQQILLYQEI